VGVLTQVCGVFPGTQKQLKHWKHWQQHSHVACFCLSPPPCLDRLAWMKTPLCPQMAPT
jgi:hypothetical protein